MIKLNLQKHSDPVNYLTTDEEITSIADAIRAKGGTSAQLSYPEEFVSAIGAIETGGGFGEIENTVNFYDYDGSLVYSYLPDEFVELSAMPANPTHSGLTAQGWNWSLADAKKYVKKYGWLNIGQSYVTDDGKTRIYLTVADIARNEYRINFQQTVANGITVNWGDGSTDVTVSGTGTVYLTHTYSATGNYVVTLDVTSGKCTLGGSSTTLLFGETNNKKYTQLNSVKKVEIGNSIAINTYAFSYCYSLASITIPSSVTSIDNYVFANCYSLASITIPNGVTSIGNNVFYSCYSLTSITIPSSVTSIGSSTFYNCYSLTSITIPNGVTSIGNSTFQNCYSLASITIPSGVTSIGTSAFQTCYSLTSITIPSGVTSIGSSTFQNCYSLVSITIPNDVTSISTSAFQSCYSLTSITIPSNVTSIGNNVFYNCSSLASITIPNDVTSIGNNAFSNCSSLTSITIPNDVTNIGNNTFQSCYSLTSITIPSNVTSIGNNVFNNCYSLASITIPNSVASISNGAFQGCYSLASITIPNDVTSIGTNVFGSCYGVKEYHLKPTTPPTLAATNAFSNIPFDCIIYVPKGTLSTYQSASNWSAYASYMQEETA